MTSDTWQADLERAVVVLAAMVRDEYPADLSLREIAETWGGTRTQNDLDALTRVDACLGELRLRFEAGS